MFVNIKLIIYDLFSITSAVLLSAFLVTTAYAEVCPVDFIEVAKLLASDGKAEDHFGFSVAIDGDTALIGAYGDDDNGDRAGAAYVIFRDSSGTWSEQGKLLASDGAAGDLFGRSVAVNGDTAVIGARGDDDNGSNSGSAYVFVRNTSGMWSEQAKLLASDGSGGELFGESVAVNGDTAVTGARFDDDKGRNSGSVYVYVRDISGTWSEQGKLIASDGAAYDYFGTSVTVDGDTVVIGAEGDDDKGSNSGSAYVFVRDSSGTWSEQGKLIASDGGRSNAFGYSVAVDQDTAVIGAWLDNDNGSSSGSAYVFVRNTSGMWSEQAKLLASDGAALDFFGVSVAVDRDTAVIGAEGDDHDDISNWVATGSAYIFVRDANGTWSQKDKLRGSDPSSDSIFGHSVAMNGDVVLIGAPRDGVLGHYSGSAYVFEPDTIDIDIDFKPGSNKNVINPREKGGIWIAILSDTNAESPFDPSSQVDIPTVEFGPNGAKSMRDKIKDINKDGLGDLLLRFMIPETGIACGDTEAALTGKTFDGQSFSGSDAIKTVGCKKPKKPKKSKDKKHKR